MIIITPHEMKNGKITALHIQLSPEKYEILEISPVGFDELGNITETISTYYDAKTDFDDMNRMMKEAEDRLNTTKEAFTKLSHTTTSRQDIEKTIIAPIPAPVRSTVPTPIGREVMSAPPKSEITDVIIDPSSIIKIDEKPIVLPEPEMPLKTPQTEARRLFDEGIHIIIRSKGKNFNETELSLEVAKSVTQEMVAATTAELIIILQANNIIKTKGKLSTFISSVFKK